MELFTSSNCRGLLCVGCVTVVTMEVSVDLKIFIMYPGIVEFRWLSLVLCSHGFVFDKKSCSLSCAGEPLGKCNRMLELFSMVLHPVYLFALIAVKIMTNRTCMRLFFLSALPTTPRPTTTPTTPTTAGM